MSGYDMDPSGYELAATPPPETGPMDMHQLAEVLAPSGWLRSLGPGDGLIGLWRPRPLGRAQFIRPAAGIGQVSAYGDGLVFQGPVGDVAEYLAKREG